MVKTILGARALHRAQSVAALAARQDEAFRVAREHGVEIVPHDDPRPLVARVDHGRWIGDCDCGSGVALERAWPEARCFGCGARYATVVWPVQADQIEAALLKRPVMGTRNWLPTETVGDLRAENIERGVESAGGN